MELEFFLIVMSLSFRTALDLKKDIEGKDCKVTEPIYNYTFDLSPLRSELGYHISSNDQPELFMFNVCGSLPKKCNNQSVLACVTNHSGEQNKIFGFKEKLLWNDGSLRLSYVGEKCGSTGKNFSMNILLHCDYSDTKSDFLGVFHESNSCEANVVMRTPYACLPIPNEMKDVKCSVESPSGDVFNFNLLRNSNHIAKGPNGTRFVIGICNPILYGHEAGCEEGTSVCQHKQNEIELNKRYQNMGVMSEGFKYDNNVISLTMSSKEVCANATGQTFSSKFIFECDNLATSSYPTYLATIDCIHMFTWPTNIACKTKKSCQVADVTSGVSFDFTSLAGIQYKATAENNTEDVIYFSICTPSKEPCLKESGSCVVTNKNQLRTLAGHFNDHLMLDGKNPYLLYEGGEICQRQGQTFTTRIDFICSNDGMLTAENTAIVIEDGCSIVIHFKTVLACGFIKNCIVKSNDDQEIDLSPLINYEGNYEATVDEKKFPNEIAPVHYLLNVCRPLNSKYTLNCHGSAGACRTVEKEGRHEEELNLGHPFYSMSANTIKGMTEVTMKYFNGETCLTHRDENITTSIKFICDEHAGLGNPILESIENCLYSFIFPTNILCNEKIVEISNNSCVLLVDGKSVDLHLFGDNGKYTFGNKTIDICSKTEEKFYTIVYKESMIRIELNMQIDNVIDVEVRLICSSNKNVSIMIDEHILVLDENSLICSLLNIKKQKSSTSNMSDSTKIPDDDVDQSKSFALGYAFLVVIVIIAFLAIYLVIRHPERREIIFNLVKFRSRRTSTVRYSRVQLNEESLLLENNNAGLNDSDDDSILM
ncbi:CLUMA_CG020112, isoform A [Clunio marinus]|uniref:CLUMA_CG020112, isoform A n=1 Tax=Clunio marinus TaxID=568069 RepID=A0A1J1J3U9_9DIPT|nr:CLUMA_CG020112, isoform A [Clunio marinus]